MSGQEKEIDQEEESEEYVLERLFSNLNQVTFKREPGDFPVLVDSLIGIFIGS